MGSAHCIIPQGGVGGPATAIPLTAEEEEEEEE